MPKSHETTMYGSVLSRRFPWPTASMRLSCLLSLSTRQASHQVSPLSPSNPMISCWSLSYDHVPTDYQYILATRLGPQSCFWGQINSNLSQIYVSVQPYKSLRDELLGIRVRYSVCGCVHCTIKSENDRF